MKFTRNPLNSKFLKQKNSGTEEERKEKFAYQVDSLGALISSSIILMNVDEGIP